MHGDLCPKDKGKSDNYRNVYKIQNKLLYVIRTKKVGTTTIISC